MSEVKLPIILAVASSILPPYVTMWSNQSESFLCITCPKSLINNE
jgi:hypothetical protein